MASVVSATRFKMEDLASVTQMPMQMAKAHAAPHIAGVETAITTANVLVAQTTVNPVCIFLNKFNVQVHWTSQAKYYEIFPIQD